MRRRRVLLRFITISWMVLFYVLYMRYSDGRKRSLLHRSINTVLDEVIMDHVVTRRASLKTSSEIHPRERGGSPGAIMTLQSSLDCLTRGIWALDTKPTLLRFTKRKYQAYTFKPSCSSALVTGNNAIAKLCSSLVAKQVLLVGPETTFHLHSLWLKALEGHENRSIHCLGPEFCTFHHVCKSMSAGSDAFAETEERFKKFPRKETLLATGSSILRYVRSTTLYAGHSADDAAYTQPVVDPETGVRVRNAYWLGHARKAHLIIMNRGPLPAPAWTYVNASFGGNWTFADNVYLNTSTAYIKDGDSFAIRIVNAALHATLTSFLPSTLHSLHVLEAHPIIRQKILIWHSSWYRQAHCSGDGPSKSTAPSLLEDFTSPTILVDPWSLYYNAQVYMQNYLVQSLLPRYGIIYFPQGLPVAPIAEVIAANDRPASGRNRRRAADCLLFPPSASYGKAMQDMLLTGLLHLVEETMVLRQPQAL
ncbi:hypothetical protein Hypma_007951 [Hypsizygus marmoreus]|uniref:Uncharacterized protein n=1 Tax=Hypsizygus marmoreus TaxID=39966 RepID=A0A369JR72_HYPMA|nr:hypothetical protein Hypma_007951 [Hypsizygus marmoreus]